MIDLLRFDITAADKTRNAFGAIKKELGGVKGALAGVEDYAKRSGRAMRNIGAGLSAGVTAPLVMLGKQSLSLYQTQVEAEQAVAQAIESTGAAAGRTLPQLKGLAGALQQATTYGDEDILRNVTAPLLTFTKVQGEVFDRAQGSVLDMATLLKMDLRSASVLVGKALNDPVKGVSALSRSGVQFTDVQKDMIKQMVEAGNVAGAQALVLSELETQFKGQAAAVAETPMGKWRQLSNAVGDVKEQLGEQIVPFLVPLADKVAKAVDWFANLSPEVKRTTVVIGGLAAVVGPIVGVLGLVTMGIGSLAGAFGTLSAVILGNPIIAAIAAIAGGAYLIYRNWDAVAGFFSGLWASVKSATASAWASIKSTISTYAPDWLKVLWSGLGVWFTTQVWDPIKGAVLLVWGEIKGLLMGEYSVEDLVKKHWRGIGAWFSGLSASVVQAFRDIWAGVKAEVATWVTDMVQVGKDVWTGFLNGLKGNEAGLEATAGSMARKVTRAAKEELDVQSPSRVFMEIGKNVVEGLGIGIRDNAKIAEGEMQQVAKGLTGVAQAGLQMDQELGSVFSNMIRNAGQARSIMFQFLDGLADRMLKSGFSTLFDALGVNDLFGNLLANAKGNAFSGGRVAAFANGGVVSSPTMFGMRGNQIGLMGEAGPEAILPLRRVGGKLGVIAAGGRQRQSVQVHNEFDIVSRDPETYVRQRTPSRQRQQAQVMSGMDQRWR